MIISNCSQLKDIKKKNLNHYAPVSQANLRNMTFTAGNLFPSHSCISVAQVKPPSGFEPRSSA